MMDVMDIMSDDGMDMDDGWIIVKRGIIFFGLFWFCYFLGWLCYWNLGLFC